MESQDELQSQTETALQALRVAVLKETIGEMMNGLDSPEEDGWMRAHMYIGKDGVSCCFHPTTEDTEKTFTRSWSEVIAFSTKHQAMSALKALNEAINSKSPADWPED